MQVGELVRSRSDSEPTALIESIMQDIARLAAQDKQDWQSRTPSEGIC